MTVEEHIAFQLCAAMDVEPTQEQWGDLVGVLIRYKHAQKIATSHLERELKTARETAHSAGVQVERIKNEAAAIASALGEHGLVDFADDVRMLTKL